MRRKTDVTVGTPSVYLSVCPIDRHQQRRPAGLLLSALLAGDIDRQLRRAAGSGAQKQMRVASRKEPTYITGGPKK